MLGVVFTEFLELVEEKFDLDTVDAILDDAGVENDGAYTAVGSYDHQEIINLVVALSKRADVPVDTLVHLFGTHLATRFSSLYPQFFSGHSDAFSFLATVDEHIHREVQKLYPNAQLPSISTNQVDDNTLVLDYRSHRHFGTLARGLIEGALAYYECDATIEVSDNSTDDQAHVRFEIRKN